MNDRETTRPVPVVRLQNDARIRQESVRSGDRCHARAGVGRHAFRCIYLARHRLPHRAFVQWTSCVEWRGPDTPDSPPVMMT